SAVTLTLVGCGRTVRGIAAFNVTGMLPADVEEVLLGAAEVSDIVGAKLQLDADRFRPITGSSAAPACSALDAVGMSAFVGETFTKFHVLLFTDGDRHQQVVAEAIAVYPDSAEADAVFAAATGAARACDGQRALGTGGDAAWSFTVPAVDADAVHWRKQQIGIPLNWVCHGEARLRNNAVLQAMACRDDDSGRATATRLADRMSATVWELSDR
ncbi:MAG: sensor domain-containing protein, partial [Mycobacterium sp.]|nr:sensor domain-containing protein [Mycobacterium sp.]